MSHLQQSLGLKWLSLKGYKNTRSSLLYPFYQKKRKRIIGHNATESQSNQIPLKKKKKKPSRSGAQHPIYATGSEQLGEGKPFTQIILLLNSVVGFH